MCTIFDIHGRWGSLGRAVDFLHNRIAVGPVGTFENPFGELWDRCVRRRREIQGAAVRWVALGAAVRCDLRLGGTIAGTRPGLVRRGLCVRTLDLIVRISS